MWGLELMQICRESIINNNNSNNVFAQREKYYGDRTRSQLVKFALDHVRAEVVELWSGNFKSRVIDDDDPVTSILPWLISYCTNDEGAFISCCLACLIRGGTLVCVVKVKSLLCCPVLVLGLNYRPAGQMSDEIVGQCSEMNHVVRRIKLFQNSSLHW